jgi:2',3'-cyclic-nucleotide 2'-phosphodiesterase (5'-nucleotidase family)
MKQLKKLFCLGILAFMIWGSWGSAALAATVNDDQSITLKIIHTNDTHSRYTYSTKNNTLGFAKLKTIINQETPDLVVDAGDIFHGQSFATIETGGSIAELMAAVGYDAMAPGNHDFNYGSSRLLELETLANTRILGNNVVYADSGTSFFDQAYLVKDIDAGGIPIRIGVFGLISPDVYTDTAPANVEGLSFGTRESVVETAKQAVTELKAQGCDVIVALTHMGDADNGQLMRSDAIAEAVSGIDVIVDGHTHDVENQVVNQTLIVQTGCYSSAVGEVALTLKKPAGSDSEVVDKSATLITAAEATDDVIPADPAVDELTKAIEAREDPIKKQVVGDTPVKLGGETDNIWEAVRLGELNLGRVLTDSYRFVTGADIAIENAGGIRAQIDPGAITKGQVIDVLPFGNYLVTKKVTGAEVLDILETSIQLGIDNQAAKDAGDNAWPKNSGSYLQWGGITAQYDSSKPAGQRVFSAKVGGSDVDPNQVYGVACNNYLATSSDYPALKNAAVVNEYPACDEAFITYLQTAGTERFLEAINTPNITAGAAPQPEPSPQPVQSALKQSLVNPRTGYSLWEKLFGIAMVIF